VVAIEMAPDEYTKACTGAPPALLAELQGHLIRGDDVVATDDALVFHTQDLLEVDRADPDEGGATLAGRASELGVEVRDEAVAQVAVRHGERGVPATRSSLTRRSCSVRFTRLLRPRACGE